MPEEPASADDAESRPANANPRKKAPSGASTSAPADSGRAAAQRQQILDQFDRSPIQDALRNLEGQQRDLSGLDRIPSDVLAGEAYRRIQDLQSQNRSALEGLTDWYRLAAAGSRIPRVASPETITSLTQNWTEQQQVLDRVKEQAATASTEAQAISAAVDDLPEGAVKDQVEEAVDSEVGIASGLEMIVPILQAQLDAQREAAARDIELGEATNKLVEAVEGLLGITQAGHIEAKRRDASNERLSKRLLLISIISLAIGGVGLAGVARDFGLFGKDPQPVVITNFPSPAPTQTSSPTSSATPGADTARSPASS